LDCSSAASAAFCRAGGSVAAAAAGWGAAGDAAEDWLRVRQTAGGVGRPVVTRMLAARPRKKLLILRQSAATLQRRMVTQIMQSKSGLTDMCCRSRLHLHCWHLSKHSSLLASPLACARILL